MKRRIDLTITAQSPLAIGQRKPGGSVSEALDYIPGTVIRGAVAAKVLKHAGSNPTPGDDFHRLFLDETAVIFSNAYPAIAKFAESDYAKSDYFISAGDIQILPATALSAKTNGGFKPEKKGVFDSLMDSYCAGAQGHFYAPNDIHGEQVDGFSGFYSNVKGRYYSHKVNTHLLTRVGINRKRATAQDEILYSIEVLDESHGKPQAGTGKAAVPVEYRSSLLLRDGDAALAQQFQTFLQTCCQKLRVGGSASRGLGKIQVDVGEWVEVGDTTDSLQKRVDSFNQKLEERWKMWRLLGGKDTAVTDRAFFTLNFQSDAILSENWRRTTVVSPAMLAPVLGLQETDITLHAAYTSHAYRSGWNAAWGLPKDTELVTERGSVLLFSIPSDQASDCYPALARLENNGLGERCLEGYGQVRVCDEFHQVMREEPV